MHHGLRGMDAHEKVDRKLFSSVYVYEAADTERQNGLVDIDSLKS